MEIDFRFNVFARNIYKNYYICKNDITNYRQVDGSIMSNIKKFSKKWWIKRHEAHKFMQKLTNDGVSIIIVSSDLSEILDLCNRVIVMEKGFIKNTFNTSVDSAKDIIETTN